jgi:signal transduction histidine kinase/DNA-binding response OmpR family regulator
MLLNALTHAAGVVAEGLPEERLVGLLAQTAVESAGAEVAAVYIQGDDASWRLDDHSGGDPEVLATLPSRGGVLAPLFQEGAEVHEPDVLGFPVRRHDQRVMGALVVTSSPPDGFDEAAIAAFRSIAQMLGVGVDNARLVVAQQREITESRRLYTQLLNSERLRAIGEMASGVAHDFNNLLASILGQVELLRPDELPPQAREAFSTIRQSALDGARIVRNLQGLARPRAETPSTFADLNETVQAALEMARPRWAGVALRGHGAIDVGLDLATDASLSRVAIDPAELREVLLNLLFNAADAMPNGGRIEVATRRGQKPKTADLLVRDTGHGMPESVRERIFEPFFSTKGPQGTGLGLAVAYSIITRRGGQIGVESVVGQGTSFTLTLPCAPTAVVPPTRVETPVPAAPASPPPNSRIRGARILVADDEPGLVAVVRQLMQRSGAEVTIAHGGPAALESLRAPGASFDVVITDLDMPEVDGWAVAAAVKAHSPSTQVVMLTGWAGDLTPEAYVKRGVDVVLAKPFSRAELEAAIGQLLDKRLGGYDVLLVDDEPAFARAVRDLLTLQGHRVTVVDSAAAALELTASRRFDALLTDFSLGEVTGAELAERLSERGSDLFVVLVTGYAVEIDDPSLMSRGIDAVIPKPCRGADLRQVLARVPTRTTSSSSSSPPT